MIDCELKACYAVANQLKLIVTLSVTNHPINACIGCSGSVAEWSIAAVLKTVRW